MCRWVGHVARVRETLRSYRIFVGTSLGRPGKRWKVNIKMDLTYIGGGCGM
jgi:hypothetical protein